MRTLDSTYGLWTVWTVDSENSGQCGLWTVPMDSGQCVLWTVRTLDSMYSGECGPWTVWTLDGESSGQCGLWTLRTVEALTSDVVVAGRVGPATRGVRLTRAGLVRELVRIA